MNLLIENEILLYGETLRFDQLSFQKKNAFLDFPSTTDASDSPVFHF